MSRKRGLDGLAIGLLIGIFLVGIIAGAWASVEREATGLRAGWGVDACLTCHVDLVDVPKFLERLREGDLRYLRERNFGDYESAENRESGRLAAAKLLRDAGYEPVGFASAGRAIERRDPWNALPEDLLAVYRESRQMARAVGHLIRIWEMVGEPDTHYCPDLPDRVAAYQKAVYLGIKDGAVEGMIPGVMMGALGLYPSPWLERAARNGLFDYTDALNVHFYGHAEDLRGMLRAHRAVADRFVKDRVLPVWLTECGLDAVPIDDKENVAGRKLQEAFTIRTAEISREEGVRVFMPFILTYPRAHEFALLRGDASPQPAWTAYAEFTRKHRLEGGAVFAAPRNVLRTVLQWMPDHSTCFPHKVSGTYQFRNGSGGSRKPMRGAVWVYNFSNQPIDGKLVIESRVARRIRAQGGYQDGVTELAVRVPPMQARAVEIEWAAPAAKRFREQVEIQFFSESGDGLSRSFFELESIPAAHGFGRREAISAVRPGEGKIDYIWAPQVPRIDGGAGPWLAINGATVTAPMNPDAEKRRDGVLGRAWSFAVDREQRDPKFPPMAIAKVDGLPVLDNGALRVRMSRTGTEGPLARIDLVDKEGQRFAVGENLGGNRFRPPTSTLILAYEDFHPYAFGRVTTARFRPEDIREVQVRLYAGPDIEPLEIRMDVLGD